MSDTAPPTAYDQLYRAITSGQIAPGDRLRESELADLLGVSRTPVREAIRRLEGDGIVEHKPRIGAVVRTITQSEVVELYEMRQVLECTAVSSAAQHASEAELRQLDNLNGQILDHEGDTGQVAVLNRAFHRCILNASRNRYLMQCSESIAHALLLLGKTTLESPERVDTVVRQHSDIIAALRAKDPKAARRAMAVHMQTALDHRLQALPGDG